MNLSEGDRGIAFVSTPEGTIVRVIRDELGLAVTFLPGVSFVTLLDGACAAKAVSFLGVLNERQAAFGWEMTVAVAGRPTPLHFVGTAQESYLCIVATRRGSGSGDVAHDLSAINNEQTNALRSVVRELTVQDLDRQVRDSHLYDDLSRLNNELANLERQMAKKNVQLEKLNEQKNRVLGMAAHDLRSPLGVIQSYSEFLQDEAGDVLDEEQREFVAVIKSTSEFMLHMVTDILDVTAIEAGQLTLNRQPTDLARLIQRAAILNDVLAGPKGIDVEVDPVPELPPLSVDAGKIEQVLNNLLGNAVKFSHRGSMVRVRLTCSGEFVTVAVVDSGQGIPEADLPKLFKPFGKASVRGTAGERSTGLGLAIARNIVEGHGGRIWLESTVGIGSTFFFTIPVDCSLHGVHVPARAPAARVLLVEDVAVNATIAVRQLRALGYTADVVQDGRAAVDAVEKNVYDIVLMDCEMPEMDGFEASREIRRREGATRHTKIIAMTSNVGDEDRQKCLAAGMDDFISKPVKTEVLGELLERWLR